jgi:hypothetical protein
MVRWETGVSLQVRVCVMVGLDDFLLWTLQDG